MTLRRAALYGAAAGALAYIAACAVILHAADRYDRVRPRYPSPRSIP